MMSIDLSGVWIFLASLAAALVIVGSTVGIIAWFTTGRVGEGGETAEKKRHHRGKHIAHGV